ncbi:hypothetical protein [Hymenobacter psychrotolerans]|uniref:Uncharacterized protein n=1 Tax=Hymenobacter psychrotolerans DSM 18569 TaxID=1121959 RepID=A0A1M6UP42_9BACT|nr:hypothetical protein [Hymenobacter psychrotolerans]SHK70957.1 hypothetical protein SAMN02746009_01430 [Hymenobacter psychrotolerans DSM 18569]
MSAIQPSFEILKQELARLHSYTTEIGKAQEITTQVQEAAVAIVDAAETMEANHLKLLEKLQAEHLRTVNEQSATVRKVGQKQTDDSHALIKKELINLRQGAEATVDALKRIKTEQPRILEDITSQHAKGMILQSDLIRQTITESATTLDTQFTAQIQELHQVKQDFSTSVGKQLDGLTSLTDRLQVISASLTAFRDSMNAARFSDRLESIGSQQGTIQARLSKLDELEAQNQNLATKLGSLKTQNTLILVLVGISVAVSVALRFL